MDLRPEFLRKLRPGTVCSRNKIYERLSAAGLYSACSDPAMGQCKRVAGFRSSFTWGEEVDKRLGVLRARMLPDAAIRSAQAELEEASREVVCPECGAKLEKKGKKKRRLQTRGGQEVELEYGICPRCGRGIFPPG